MTNKIQKIYDKYPHPDQKLLPNVYLFWDNSKGRNWLNCKTGNITKNVTPAAPYIGTVGYRNMKDDIIYVQSGATLKYAYCKYHSAAKLLEFSVVTMSSNRTGGARIWEYAKDAERYFIDKDKHIYTVNGEKDSNSKFVAYQYHEAYRFDLYLNILYRCNFNDKIMNEFKKFIGKDTIIVGNGQCLTLNYFYQIPIWYKTKPYKESNGKVQKLLNEITSLPHSDLSDICRDFDVFEDTTMRYASRISDVIYFEHLNDEWSVLRYCTRTYDNDNVESYRVYISEDGDCKITKKNDIGKWIPAQSPRGSWRWSYGRIVNFEDMAKCQRLSYIMPILRNLPIRKQLDYLALIIKFPQIEKLYKMGYDRLATDLLNDGTVNANIQNKFGELNKGSKTIFGEFGLSKRQFDIWMQYYGSGQGYSTFRTCIPDIKRYFGNDLSSIDDETFEQILKSVARIRSNSWQSVKGTIDLISVDGKSFIKNICRLLKKYDKNDGGDEILRLINDTVNSYRGLYTVDRPQINWIFEDRSDIVRAHDSLVELRRIQDEERRLRYNVSEMERHKKEDEKRQKVDEKRKHYEYEDDNYIIRLPLNVKEIVEEGTTQHICIGGYTSRHSTGDTNLFFLRKKTSPDTPFYAIEMNNDKKIIQIHGFGNKWLGNDPDAIPTVIRWLRKNDIKCDSKILTCTARGYGANGHYVDMPVVD